MASVLSSSILPACCVNQLQVNIKFSDLFPPEPTGRKLHSSSSSSSSNNKTGNAAGSSRHLTATLLQATRSTDSGLSAYMRSNPTVAPALQELTGGTRSPSISDSSEAKSVKLCDLFTDSLCTAAGARRRLLGKQLQGLKMWGQRMLQTARAQQQQPESDLPAAAAAAPGQHISATARRSLQQRDNLTTSQAEGLATWARQAPDSDVQYVQAIVGGGFISGAQATPQLTIDQVVGPQQAAPGGGGRRKAGRKMLLLLPPVDVAHGSAGGSSSSSRALLDDATGNGGGTGIGTGSAAGASGSDSAGAGPGVGAGAGGADGTGSDAGNVQGASSDGAAPVVTASSGSSLDLLEWTKGASEEDKKNVQKIVGEQVLAPGSRPSADTVKLSDVGGR
jgi:hypothetical protein